MCIHFFKVGLSGFDFQEKYRYTIGLVSLSRNFSMMPFPKTSCVKGRESQNEILDPLPEPGNPAVLYVLLNDNLL